MRAAPRHRGPAPGPIGSFFLCALLLLAAPALAAPETAPPETPQLAELERLAEAGRYEELVARLEPMVAAGADSAEPRFLLGNAYVGQGRYDDAIDVYVGLTRDFPGRPEPHNNLAVIFVEQGRLEEARTALLAAARLRPGYARAQDNLGDLYMLMAESSYARAEAIRARISSLADKAREGPMTEGAPASTERPAQVTDQRSETVLAAPPAASDRRQPAPIFALGERRAVLAAVERWREAWSAQDVDAYLDSYLPDYRPDARTSNADWRRIRRDRLTRPEWIEVELEALELVDASGDGATVRFEQRYSASNYSDVGRKELRLTRREGRWRIAAEQSP